MIFQWTQVLLFAFLVFLHTPLTDFPSHASEGDNEGVICFSCDKDLLKRLACLQTRTWHGWRRCSRCYRIHADIIVVNFDASFYDDFC